ncbi:MAG: hypothetical protein Q4C70_11120 [Planctomycetia bacterium]|nr:hypothetical protein [Planctomycetia bacterium]
MFKFKFSILFGSLFFLTACLGTALYSESGDNQLQKEAVLEIVQSDVANAEMLLNSTVEMENWANYLNITDLKATLGEESETALETQNSLLVKLRNAYGVEKYPQFCALRESLSTLHATRKVSSFQTLFQKRNVMEKLIAARENMVPMNMTMVAETSSEIPVSASRETEEIREVAMAQSTVESNLGVEEPNLNDEADLQNLNVEERNQNLENLNQIASIFAQESRKMRDFPEVTPAHSAPLAMATERVDKHSVQKAYSIVTNPISQENDDALSLQKFVMNQNKLLANNTENTEAAKDEKDEKEVKDTSKPENAEIAQTMDEFLVLPTLHFSLEEPVNKVVATLASSQGEENPPLQLTGNAEQDFVTMQKAWRNATYRPMDETAHVAAYQEVLATGRSVEKLLNKSTRTKRDEWKKLLSWELMDFRKPVDSAALKEIYDRLSCGAFGLEFEFFVDMREAIAHYLAVEAQIRTPDLAKEVHETARLRMAALLTLAHQEKSSSVQRAIEDLADWFNQMGQAPELIIPTCQLWGQPNVVAHIDASVFERFGDMKMEEDQAVNERIQEATVRGTAHFSGDMKLRPVPNENKIELGIQIDGNVTSNSRAYQGPAIVSSRAESKVSAQKSIFIDETGFKSSKTDVKSTTKSQITNIQDARNRPAAESAISRRAYARKGEMEQRANAQTANRLRQRINQSIDPMLNNLNKEYEELVQRQFNPRGLVPQQTRTWSDDAGIHALTNLSCRDSLSAPGVAPEFPQKCDIQFTIHESAVQNSLKAFLRGLNLNESARKNLADSAPDWMKPAESAEKKADQNAENTEKAPQDWTIRFTRNWPIAVSFNDGKVIFTMQCEEMVYDGKDYPALTICAIYTLESRDSRLFLVRQGDIEILPPDFNPAEKKRLPSSMVSLRRVMSKRLEEMLKKEIILEARPVVKNSDGTQKRFENVYILPVVAKSENGWLQVGFNLEDRQPQSEPVK